jgi:hypothetical protein
MIDMFGEKRSIVAKDTNMSFFLSTTEQYENGSSY